MKPREAALKALYKIEKEGAYSNIALKETLFASSLDGRDKAFVTNLVYGVVMHKNSLDYVLARYSSVKLKKLSDYVLLILRMGVYQLFYMDKVPSSAAINESVKLSKKYAARSSGFINAVLRNADRGGDIIKASSDISIRLSYPEEIVNLFSSQLGDKRAESLMEALNSFSSMTVRANSMKISAQELSEKLSEICEAKVIPDVKNAVFVSGLDVAGSELYKSGYFSVQGISAMLSVEALDVRPGMRVLDMCAAPGGKTTYIGELLKGEGEVIAHDIHEHKIELINKNIKRLGIKNASSKTGDACVICAEYLEGFDRVLCDVPCSGLGIIAKKPDIKWTFKPSYIAKTQLRILENGAKYLKRGGEMVYSTCTLNKKENEDVINLFLENNEGYELLGFEKLISSRFSGAERGYITLYPDIDKADGFFIAKIKRK